MASILKGIKVIEMGHFVAVPAAAAMMADWGADVIKIEPLTGDAQRSQYVLKDDYTLDLEGINFRFEVHNRNKKGIAIDLSRASGREIVTRLIGTADVFISNYELHTLRKFGLDYQTLSRSNGRLIYGTLTGYGTQGPDKDERGFDVTAGWARPGIQHLLGDRDCAPPQALSALMDRVAGTTIVAGILAALLEREHSGKGQALELSLYHTGVWALAGDIQMALTGNKPLKNDRAARINPLVNTYRTKDNRWIQLAMFQPHLHWHDFCLALDKPELEQDPRFPTDNLVMLVRNREQLVRELDEVFATRILSEWEKRLKAGNCIFSRIWTPEEVVKDPQARDNGFFLKVEYSGVGEVELVNTPVNFVEDRVTIKSKSPEIGEHTEEILLQIGYSWEEISGLKEQGAIL
jgi:crotonobetainyl-CoA:carnitine CoA-transferase CaiB-like acyl-CoA transferase